MGDPFQTQRGLQKPKECYFTWVIRVQPPNKDTGIALFLGVPCPSTPKHSQVLGLHGEFFPWVIGYPCETTRQGLPAQTNSQVVGIQ